MPIYEFICQACGEAFEELVFSASKLDQVVCPHCQSKSIQKKISLIASRSERGNFSASSAASCTTST